MSGGIDSSVAALILQHWGYEVAGVSFWFFSERYTCNEDEAHPDFIIEAKNIARQVGIKHDVLDVRKEFRLTVIQDFIDEYMLGKTPSPCILCNSNLKWRLLMEYSEKLGAEYIATGHYIRIKQKGDLFYIRKGKDLIKDQSYFLWNLKQNVLKKTLSPLGDFTKEQIREMANFFGYEKLAKKKESMGVCFLQRKNYRDFLQEMLPDLNQRIGKGQLVDRAGKLLGKHEGFPYYTIGQKRALYLNENANLMVSKIHANTNTLVLEPEAALYKKQFKVENYYFHDRKDAETPKITTAIRGLGRNPRGFSKITILNENELTVSLEHPAWAVAPGQAVAFYIGNTLIGGGFVAND